MDLKVEKRAIRHQHVTRGNIWRHMASNEMEQMGIEVW